MSNGPFASEAGFATRAPVLRARPSSPLGQLADDLASGRTTSEELIERCLASIADESGEGRRAFLFVDAYGARRAARANDDLRRAAAEPSRYAGIPISINDVFDVRGQVTRAGSRVLAGPPSPRDAAAVARLRRAGLVVIGRTTMTEFAFSGLGLNPHYGTPANPWERERRRIPGGSSSGAAISISDGMAHGALGTDTGGSCRIPAALCGLVGFKPTQARVPRDGIVPLSPTLDTVGVLARTVGCCAALDTLLRAAEPEPPRPLAWPPRLAVPRNYLLADLDDVVGPAFERALSRLREAGADLVEIALPELDDIPEMNAGGGFAAVESFAWHRELASARAGEYDQRGLVRIRRGEQQGARDLLVLHERRRALIGAVRDRLEGVDAFVCPTVPAVAPLLEELEDDDEYTRTNLLMPRNPTVTNLLDGCGISIPMHDEGEPPTGLMVNALAGQDDKLLRIAAWIEARL
jgi:aspartyl-tRNA(Asn)/glutamyl-tRNA(Gln) amidotransferase subunit A